MKKLIVLSLMLIWSLSSLAQQTTTMPGFGTNFASMLLTHDQAREFHTGSKGEKDVEKAPPFMKNRRLLVMKKANIGWGCANEF